MTSVFLVPSLVLGSITMVTVFLNAAQRVASCVGARKEADRKWSKAVVNQTYHLMATLVALSTSICIFISGGFDYGPWRRVSSEFLSLAVFLSESWVLLVAHETTKAGFLVAQIDLPPKLTFVVIVILSLRCITIPISWVLGVVTNQLGWEAIKNFHDLGLWFAIFIWLVWAGLFLFRHISKNHTKEITNVKSTQKNLKVVLRGHFRMIIFLAFACIVVMTLLTFSTMRKFNDFDNPFIIPESERPTALDRSLVLEVMSWTLLAVLLILTTWANWRAVVCSRGGSYGGSRGGSESRKSPRSGHSLQTNTIQRSRGMTASTDKPPVLTVNREPSAMMNPVRASLRPHTLSVDIYPHPWDSRSGSASSSAHSGHALRDSGS